MFQNRGLSLFFLFELAAADYLLKPANAARLLDALKKAQRLLPDARVLQALAPAARTRLRVVERGRVVLVPVDSILYLRAEQKYVTARTAGQSHECQHRRLNEEIVHTQ